MANETCIVYPAKSIFLMVRAPLIAICQIPVGEEKKPAPDAQAAAVILHQFIFWTDGKLSTQHQSRYHESAATSEGETSQQDNSLWIYKDYDELKLDLLDLFGRNKVIDNVQWLVLAGYLKRRTNPRYRWDKTLQYSVDIEYVQSQINALPEFNSKLSIVPNQTTERGKNKRAIPENTSQKRREESKDIAPSGAGDVFADPISAETPSASLNALLPLKEQTAKPARTKKPEKEALQTPATTPPPKGSAQKVPPHVAKSATTDTPAPKKARSAKQVANDEAKTAAANALAGAMGMVLAKSDQIRYAQIAQTLITSTIMSDEFDLYVRRLQKRATGEGWTVTVESLLKNGRPSEYVTAREKSRQNGATRDLQTTSVGIALNPSQNAYNPHLDPAYTQRNESAK